MISIKKVSELEKMLCSYNFLAQNLLIMMTFCRVCVSNWWASLHDFCPLEGCSPARQGRNCPPILPSSEKTALSSRCRDLGSSFEAQRSVDGVRALPTVPLDFATAKGWCLNEILSFGAALGLSATSILSAWGTALKDMASEVHWCPCTLAFMGRGKGQASYISPWCLEGTKE